MRVEGEAAGPVVIVTPEYPTTFADGGGLASFLARWAAALRDQGWRVLVFSLAPSGGQEVHEGIAVTHVAECRWGGVALPGRLRTWLTPVEMVVNAWRLWRRLEALPRDVRPCLVHTSDFLATGLFLGSRWRGAPVILRCSWVRREYAVVDRTAGHLAERAAIGLEEQAVRQAAAVYCPAEDTRDRYQRIARRPIHVIRPPLPAQVATTSGGPGVLHFAGYLSRRKGSDIALRAIVRARQLSPGIRGLVVGRCSPAVAAELADAQSWSEVSHVQSLARSELQALLAEVCCVVLPSRIDNLPNAALEALRAGIPVVTTRGSSIDEVVRDGVDGYVLDADEVEQMAQRIADISQGRGGVRRPIAWDHPLREQMAPSVTVARTLGLAQAAGAELVPPQRGW